MKRVISLFICVLMCFSFFSATAGQVYALGNAEQAFSVTTDGFADDEITFTVSLSAGHKKVTGVILQAAFDSSALQVVEAGAAGSYNADGDFAENVAGVYETGVKYDDAGVYALAYMNTAGYTTGSATEMFTITFEAISEERRPTSVEFVCIEFITADDNDTNDITKADGIQTVATSTFDTLSQPKVTEVNSVEGGLSVVWSKAIGAESYTLYRKTADTDWAPMDAVIDGSATEFVDTTVVQGTEYFYTISAANSYSETTYAETGAAGMNFGSISSITATAVSTGAKITWSSLAGAEKYELLRKLSSSDNWQTVSTTTSCEYIDESIASGVSYDYRVRAIQGKYAAGMAVDPVSVRFIATPVVYVQNANGGIDVSFDEVGGAAKYIVEKSVNGGAYTVVAELSEAEGYFDEDVVADSSYSYKVQAIAEDGMTGEKATTDAIVRLGMPTVSGVSNTETGVELTWNTVNGADEYTVYRKGNGSEWNAIADTTATSYTDTTVESGVEYTYAVSAVNETGESGFEASASVLYIATPEIVSVSTVASGIKVVWSEVNGAAKYSIYRTEVNSDAWAVIGTAEGDTYIDKTAVDGVYYKYTVDAFNGDVKSAYNKNGVEGMYFGTITEISAVANENGATVTWGALPKATSYKVFRKTADDSKWTEVAEVTGNSYDDNAIASGVLYYYMVKAYSGNNVAETTAEAPSVKYIASPDSIAQNVGAGIKITVTPVAGADTYKIYKSTAGGAPVFIATLTDGETEYTDTDVEAYQEYSYTVYASSDNISSAGKTSATITRLGAPKNITLTNTIPGIKVTWDAVDDAVLYEIYRKEGSQKKWEKIAEVSSTTYTDGTVFGDEYYSYTVSAVTADGGNSGYNEDGATYLFLETPDLTSVTNVSGGIKFTWEAVDGATGYKVFRKARGSGWEVLDENFEGTSFTDKTAKGGTTYTYTVRALNNGYESYFDSGLSIVAVSKPATPKLTKIENTASGVKVTWGKVSGAEKYIVYRKTYNAKTKKWGGWTNLSSKVTSTSYVDKTAKSGTYYLYTVKATNAAGNSGYNKSGIKTYFLSTPTLSSVANASGKITVKWSKVSGATGYIVYRRTYNAKTKTWGGWSRLGTTKSTSYSDTKETSGTYYRYTVRAYYGDYTGYFNTTGLKIYCLSTPTLKSASSSKSGITVKWNKVTGASGYIVYRKTGSGGWKQMAIVKGNAKVSYLDKTAKKGTTYKYTVKAYYSNYKSYYNTKGISCKDRY